MRKREEEKEGERQRTEKYESEGVTDVERRDIEI